MSDPKRTEADPYEVNALFDYIRAMVDSQWPSHEIAETLLLLGYVSPEQHRATEQALSAECAGRHAAEKRANQAEARLSRLDCALRAHAPRDVRHAVLADLADPT